MRLIDTDSFMGFMAALEESGADTKTAEWKEHFAKRFGRFK